MIIYGINSIREALSVRFGDFRQIIVTTGKQEKSIIDVLGLAAVHKIPIERRDRKELNRLAGTEKHQGILGILKEFIYSELEDILQRYQTAGGKAFLLVLDCIQDPQNLGSLIRTANASGVNGVIIPKDRAAGITPTVVKASTGAIEHIPICRVTNIAATIDRLKDAGIWVIGIEAGCGKDIYSFDMDTDLAIVIGSEGKGIRQLVKEKCDVCLSIPIKGNISSLNASVAGGIVLFEVLRQRFIKKS